MNEAPSGEKKSDWLEIASDSFKASTNYLDSNYRKQFERNIALFQSRHPAGSKYNSAAYKSRSRLFRPKTKSTVRKNEAAAAAAFFANVDVVTVEPENDADQMQVVSAELMNEIVNYRLTKTVPWFVTVMGAVQEAQVIGIVGSYQYWHYKEKAKPGMGEDGQELGASYEVTVDKPCIELMPVENYRFDPAADWTDVVNSSPYFIRMVPMYVDDVRQRMKEQDSKTGQPKWKKLDDGEIRQAMVDYDSIRQQREQKQDPLVENNEALKEFDIVWCHENFVRLAGEEWVYWTMGTQHMLSDPVPLKEAYFTGERPFVVGCAVIEAHKAVPDSLVGITSELVRELNDTVNQRRDNVSLVLNKRYIVKRGASVDTDSLLRNVPGGVTLANDPELDIKEMNWPDVTGSAYQEQDRLNVDFDELAGNFSQSSVQTNRKLNETVGGMELMSGGAGQLTEYLLRTIVETWMEKVLTQLVKMEQAYETDAVVLGLAGAKAKLAQKYGVNQITDELLNQSLTVRVSVGQSATDPQKKLARFLGSLRAGAEAMQLLPNANQEAIWNEIMGLAGYKGASRFFEQSGPNQALMQHMQEMQQQLQEAMQKAQQAGTQEQMAKIAAAQANLKAQQATLQAHATQAKSGIDLAIANNKPGTQAPAPDMKPALDKIKNDIDAQILDYDKKIAILQVQLAEKTAELQLTKAQHGVQMQAVQGMSTLTQAQHGVELGKKDIALSQKDAAAQADSKSKDLAMQGQEVKHAKEKDKEVEKKVAERPDHSKQALDSIEELKGIVAELAKPKTKVATKDPKTGAWTVKES